ncbi:Gly-Xaa carboxypeptidase, partial [Phenoliferia sp. Uapishka_3]
MDPEKQPLTGITPAQAPPRRRYITPRSVGFLLIGLLLIGRLITGAFIFTHVTKHLGSTGTEVGRCTQFDALVPPADAPLDQNHETIFSEDYRLKSVKIHSGLVQVKSESFDDNGDVGGPNRDVRWDNFYEIAKYLEKTFPLLHEKLTLTKVNTHGLVFTWEGSDTSLAPSLFMAHQDTVPVNPSTLNLWTYAPWSGHYDGKYVWGRGAADCKNTLSGILEAVTLLLEGGFKPQRTAVFAFGFDEESKGWEGAGEISKYLEGVYGKDGFAFAIDEGGLGIGEMYGAAMALPATGEKGYIDVNFTLHTPGGHSSIPPPHTGIGILSSIVTHLESSPYSPSINLESPIFSLLQCVAEHGKLPGDLKTYVDKGSRAGKWGARARQIVADKFAALGRAQRYLVSTSQAADVIGGGVKVNALPETSYVVVNYRVAVDSSPQVVIDKITTLMLPIAHKFSLDLDAFGQKFSFKPEESLEGASDEIVGGELKILAVNALEPAPISPTASKQWKILSSTIQHVYQSKYPDGLVVSPSVMTGNTDTRFMWNLTKHIYRFTPMDRAASFGIHTVDEHLLFDDHIDGVWFFHELIRNSDAAEF